MWVRAVVLPLCLGRAQSWWIVGVEVKGSVAVFENFATCMSYVGKNAFCAKYSKLTNSGVTSAMMKDLQFQFVFSCRAHEPACHFAEQPCQSAGNGDDVGAGNADAFYG